MIITPADPTMPLNIILEGAVWISFQENQSIPTELIPAAVETVGSTDVASSIQRLSENSAWLTGPHSFFDDLFHGISKGISKAVDLVGKVAPIAEKVVPFFL